MVPLCAEVEMSGRKGRKRKGAGTKRKLKGSLASTRGPRSFARLLEDVSALLGLGSVEVLGVVIGV